MKKAIIIALLLVTSTTFLKAQRINMITEGVTSNDDLATMASYKNDLEKLELKGKVKTLTVKGEFQEYPINDIYAFNQEGKLTSYKDIINTSDEQYTYTYTPDGNLETFIAQKGVLFTDGAREIVSKIRFNYQGGRLISHQQELNDNTIKYTYNGQGELTQIGEDYLFNNKGQITLDARKQAIYTYDNAGKLQKRTSLVDEMDYTTKHTSTYTYNAQGDIIKVSTLIQEYENLFDMGSEQNQGKITGTRRSLENYLYVYDSKGNWTKLTGSNKANLTRRIEYYPE